MSSVHLLLPNDAVHLLTVLESQVEDPAGLLVYSLQESNMGI